MKHLGFRRLARFVPAVTFVQRFGGFSPVLGIIVLELSNRCNLNCFMCPQARQRERALSFRPADMPMVILTRVIGEASRRPVLKPLVHLIGGEPLLHPQFLEAVGYIRHKGMQCSLTSNGTLLEQYARDLVDLSVSDVKVSIDGPEAIHNEIRGADWAYRRTIQGIEALLNARSAAGTPGPHVSISCTVSAKNYQHLSEMVEVASETRVDALSIQHLIFADGTAHGIDVGELMESLWDLRVRAKERQIPLSFYPRMSDALVGRYYQEPSSTLGETCVLPWFATRVLPNGSISPCRGFVASHVTDEGHSLAEGWNGPRIRAYRMRIATKGLFADCDRCCHRIYRDRSRGALGR